LKANSTEIDFIIENKNVLLIDDVLYTGRSVSAALSAMTAFGRPRKVDLLVLIDRKYSRDLPIEPRYVGLSVNTIQSQRIKTQWSELGFAQDEIWLVANEF
jgi:pyrimidine operon attenuation protein/uracil phosphoribosyltransferase